MVIVKVVKVVKVGGGGTLRLVFGSGVEDGI